MIDSGIISGKIAKIVLMEMLSTGKGPEQIVKEKALEQISDDSEIENIIE